MFKLAIDFYKTIYRIAPKQVSYLTANWFLSIPIIPIQLFLTKQIVDKFQNWNGNNSINQLMFLAVLLGGALFIDSVLSGTFMTLKLTVLYEVADIEKERLIIAKTSRLALIDLENPSISDRRCRALSIEIVEVFQQCGIFVSALLSVFVLLLIITLKGSFVLTISTLIVMVIAMLLYSKSSGDLEKLSRKQISQQRFTNYLSDILMEKKSIREIRLFNAVSYLKEKWILLFNKNRKEAVSLGIKSELMRMLPDLVLAILGAVLSVIVAFIIINKNGTAGDFTLLFQTTVMLYGILPVIINGFGTLKASFMKWEDFSYYINLPEETYCFSKPCSIVNDKDLLDLKVSNLSFKYPNASIRAINNISFQIPKGTKIALVGENGSGKSTLIKLLLGLYKPDEGNIKWPASLEPRVSAVFQDYSRYYLTIRENIALGNIELINDDEELLKALKSADDNKNFFDLEEQLGSSFNGRELSGGQWQRLATARAYARDGTIIFFDEPTAALDPKAEEEAFKTFLNITEGKTAFLVTHRLGAAQLTDYILLLKAGSLVEQGTHKELLEKNGEYARMYALQAAWYI